MAVNLVSQDIIRILMVNPFAAIISPMPLAIPKINQLGELGGDGENTGKSIYLLQAHHKEKIAEIFIILVEQIYLFLNRPYRSKCL